LVPYTDAFGSIDDFCGDAAVRTIGRSIYRVLQPLVVMCSFGVQEQIVIPKACAGWRGNPETNLEVCSPKWLLAGKL
jgi:hypothetical protein